MQPGFFRRPLSVLATEFAVVEIIKCFISRLALDALFFIWQLAEGFAGFDVFFQLGFVAFGFIPCSATVKIFFAGRMQLVLFGFGLSVVGLMVFVDGWIGRGGGERWGLVSRWCRMEGPSLNG